MKKRKVSKKRKPRIIFILFIFSILLIDLGIYFQFTGFSLKSTIDVKKSFETLTKTPKVYSADMVMVGDALIHSSIYVDAKQKDAEAARKTASGKMSEASTSKGNLDAVMARTMDAAVRETGSEDLASACEAAEKEVLSLNETLTAMRKEEEELRQKSEKATELNTAVPNLRKELEEKSSEVKKIEKNLTAVSASLAAAEARYKQVRKDLAFDSREDAENSRTGKVKEAKRLRDGIGKAMKALNDAESGRDVNAAKINELEKVVEGYKPVDESAAAEAAIAAESKKKTLTELNIQLAADMKSAGTALNLVKSGAADLERIRREHEIIDSLSRTANGLLTGKERITLESYVHIL